MCFTGMASALFQHDKSATGKTYLWMHPIYGATALGMEVLHERLKFLPRPVRALAYTAVILGAEYSTGWLLRRALGRCPWDYEKRGWNLHGLIRLDYAPAWYGTALLFEPVREALLRLTAEALRQTPEVQRNPPVAAAMEAVEAVTAGHDLPSARPLDEEAQQVDESLVGLEAQPGPWGHPHM